MNTRKLSIAVICMILGIILAIQYKSVLNNSTLPDVDGKRLEDIKTDLLDEKGKNENLSTRISELEKEKADMENVYTKSNSIEETLKRELEQSRLVAGLTDVKGAGIIITLDDNENEFGIVTDSDILNVVNELRASGAQAISVNGQRIVSISEIREAGKNIVVNSNKLSVPYEIKAISDPTNLKNALTLRGGVFEDFEKIYHIKFNIETKDEIIIPKVDSSIIKTNYLKIISE